MSAVNEGSNSASFYLPEGPRFRATENTRGPWGENYQHGGPPAALLARAIEVEAPEFHLARLTIEFLCPVLIGLLDVECRPLGQGRQVGRFEASLNIDGVEVAHARALGIRRKALEFPRVEENPRSAPANSAVVQFPFFDYDIGYHTSVELRTEDGRIGDSRKMGWIRMRLPLVAGERPTPLQRVMVAADCGHGISAPLDWREFVFINPDLTVYTSRPADGEWIGLEASSDAGTLGVGLAKSRLWDESGPLGHSQQALFIDRRR